jgi:hypothetical protein
MSILLNISNISFKNKYTIYENNIKCAIKDYEYNTSQNPTLRSGSTQFIYLDNNEWIENTTLPLNYSGSYYTNPSYELKSFVTSSDFNPYLTTIGLYNDSNQLLAIAKLAQPLPLSNKTDTTILIKLDF